MNTLVTRLNDRELSIKWDNPAGYSTRIELLTQDNKAIHLHETSNDYCIIKHKTFFRPLYRLTCSSRVVICSERLLPLEGTCNFRDAGGYITESGLIMRYGKVFRSDHLNRLTDKDLFYLTSTGIRINIDYRKPEETSKQPDRFWDEQLQILFCTPDASSAELAAQAASDSEKIAFLLQQARHHNGKLQINGSGELMKQQYREFVYHPDSVKAWRTMLLLLANSGEFAVNQHCRGGKDRTGFGIALVHLLLGVKKTDVMRDYMLTNTLRAERNRRRMAQYRAQTTDHDVLAFLFSLMETRAEYLDASLDEIVRRHGSVEHYFFHGLGIAQATIRQVKELCLTA